MDIMERARSARQRAVAQCAISAESQGDAVAQCAKSAKRADEAKEREKDRRGDDPDWRSVRALYPMIRRAMARGYHREAAPADAKARVHEVTRAWQTIEPAEMVRICRECGAGAVTWALIEEYHACLDRLVARGEDVYDAQAALRLLFTHDGQRRREDAA